MQLDSFNQQSIAYIFRQICKISPTRIDLFVFVCVCVYVCMCQYVTIVRIGHILAKIKKDENYINRILHLLSYGFIAKIVLLHLDLLF